MRFIYRTAIDFDGDGDLDFAGNTDTVAQPSNNVGVLLNDGHGGLSLRLLSLNNGAFGGFFGGTWADFNADGRPDFLGNFSNAPFRVIFFNDGNGNLTSGLPLNFAVRMSTFRPSAMSTAIAVKISSRPDRLLPERMNQLTFSISVAAMGLTRRRSILVRVTAGISSAISMVMVDVTLRFAATSRIPRTTPSNTCFRTATARSLNQPETNLGRFRLEGVREFNHDGIDDFYGTTNFSTTVSVYISQPGQSHVAADFR